MPQTIPCLAFSTRWLLILRISFIIYPLDVSFALSRSLDLILPESTLAYPNHICEWNNEECLCSLTDETPINPLPVKVLIDLNVTAQLVFSKEGT